MVPRTIESSITAGVDARADGSVGDVVDVGGQVVALGAFGYECAQLYIFDDDFLHADMALHDARKRYGVQIAGLLRAVDGAHLLVLQMLLQSLLEAHEGYLGGVGDE